MALRYYIAAFISLVAASLALAQSQSQVQAQQCDVPMQLNTATDKSFLKSMGELFSKGPRLGLRCGSLSSVMSKMFQQGKVGGRRLEGDKGMNMAAANEEWQSAIREPEIARKVEELKSASLDRQQFLFFVAVLMDEEGYYGARDLVIGTLTEQIK